MTFPETDAELRTDADFVAFDEIDVEGGHCQGESPMQGLSVGMVSQFPIDYIHLCSLRVTRPILRILTKGPLKFRLGSRVLALHISLRY